MVDRTDDAPATAPVPDASHLARLGPDDWAVVLRHARSALRDLDDDLVTPRLRRLRAVPVSRLLDGRSRRDLCLELAGGGPLWRATAERLAADPDADLEWLLSPEAAAPPRRPTPSPPADDGDDVRVHRSKERARQLLEERDEARRRATGLEARLRTEQERLEELGRQVAALREERDRLEERLEEAAEQRRQAVERVRRQQEAEIAELREELRAHRRREQERRRRQERRGRRRRQVEERAAEEIARYRRSRRARTAEPGRPSKLPPGVAPGTTEEVAALLTRGRRLLVDGYNVTKQHRDHLALEQQRGWLVRRMEQLSRRTGVRCTLVFDGDPAAGGSGAASRRVRTVFTAGGTADDRIVGMVADLPDDEPVVVVTDDGELRERLRGRGVDVIGTRPFLGYLR